MSEFAGPAVFLSYASQDAEAARRICEALRGAGVEVWFDADGGLEHGDEWDAKIRRQIKECVLFIPIISANTQARLEGYFRIEWDLAAERARGIASGVPFILPAVIDDTREPDALVPDRFRMVQWTRLQGGEVPADVRQRLLKLWSHRTGALKHAATPAGQDPAQRPFAQVVVEAGERPRRRWLGGIVGATLALGVLGAVGWILRPQAGNSSAPTTSAGSAASMNLAGSTVALSEPRKLVAKAWELLNKPGLARAELDAADTLCRRAATLDPTDAVVWATWTHVHSWFVAHGLDLSPARREAGRDCAAKAMQFDARALESRLAQATYWLRAEKVSLDSPKGREAETLLRDLLREQPDEPRTLLMLGRALLRSDQGEAEGMSLCERAAAHPTLAATTWLDLGWFYLGRYRYAEAEAAVDRSMVGGVNWNNLGQKMMLALHWHGDLKLAQAIFEQYPTSALQEDWGIAHACDFYEWSRDPQGALSFLGKVAKEWLSSNTYHGPVAYLAGKARQAAGQTTAAKRDFRRALQLIDQRLKDTPNDAVLLTDKALVHVSVGERDAAAQTYRLIQELQQTGGQRRIGRLTLGKSLALRVLLDSPEIVIDELENRRATAAALRLNPALDPLRSHPRFVALLARAETDPQLSPNAAVVSAPAPSQTSPSLQSAPSGKSVAVLAFANLSGDRDNEYFSDGISEELLNVLCKVPGLKVTARTSSFYFKGKQVPIPEIAEKLGVAYVVEGSVRKAGNRVRITAQLIKAVDGFHVWSDNFDRELKDIFAVQDEIAGLIAQNLKLTLGTAPKKARTIDPEAYRLLLEGRHFFTQRNEDGFARADAAFTGALKIDPDFAEAHTGLAKVAVIRANFRNMDGRPGYDHIASDLERARLAAQRAIALDPTESDAYSVLGFVLMIEGRLAESEQQHLKAIAVNPNSATAQFWHGALQSRYGRVDLEMEGARKASQLDPLMFMNLFIHAQNLAGIRRYEEAWEVAVRAAALRPDIFIPLRGEQARILLGLGRHAEAAAAARDVLRHPEVEPRMWADSLALWVLRQTGFAAEAEAHLAALLGRYSSDSFQRGFILTSMGRFADALPSLEHAPVITKSRLLWDEMWDPYRADPRFASLLAKLDLTDAYRVARETQARLQREQPAGGGASVPAGDKDPRH